MALGDTINFLLHRAGVSVDVEGDGRHVPEFAFAACRHGRTCSGHPRLALIRRMAGGWVYFVTNRRDGILYAGVTSNLPRRIYEHREGLVDGFTKRHGLKRLVYAE
ncbi:MAG: GIY-YIG nuclease family protein, partial [Xanthobacteraceae bacterium]